ncbi:MAG: hypothetical protein CMF41_01480 [Legionellales bacterium]|nr:hypothetical protein [Legionellales bacterium]OUX66128.1 MAG: hypothetical protein CBE41_00690 [Gammaproteobacteria bacterium TMED281]
MKRKEKIILHALKILMPVVTQGKFLDRKSTHFENNTALLWEICMDVLRWFDRYQMVLESFLTKKLKQKDVEVALIMIICISSMMKKPDKVHYIINEAVETCGYVGRKWSKPLVNGVLRKIANNIHSLKEQYVDHPQWVYSHPNNVLEKIKKQWPLNWQSICLSHQSQPKVWINTDFGGSQPDVDIKKHAYVPNALLLSKSSTSLDMRKTYIQDIASQHLKLLLPENVQAPILDACAAPGGKTVILAGKYPNGKIIAVDKTQEKTKLIEENISRLGLKNVHVLQNDWLDATLDETFGLIIVDVPCSATGTIKRHPEKKRHTIDYKALQQHQLEILLKVWSLLLPNGILIYSTCSIFEEENDCVIEQFIASAPNVQVKSCFDSNIGEKKSFGTQLLPTDNQDGHYFCKLQKVIP